mgnify:CR=1 FL=1|tara:strand:- start:2474 stop:3400 length:927 start_codon:yes stop_codon:yes gene_type:complete
MEVDYTITSLIASVKRRCSVPTAQSLFQNTDFASLLSEEMQSIVVPIIMSEQENYFVHFKDEAIDGTTKEFRIPDRAIGGKLKDVAFYNSASDALNIRPRLGLDDYGNAKGNFVGDLTGYFLRDNKIVFKPAPTNSNDSLRIYYYRRPSNLVQLSESGKITDINTGTKTITFDTVQSSWGTSKTFDLIRGRGMFQSLGDDLAITAMPDSSSITFTETLPTDLAVGDYVALAGKSPIAQVPYEAHHLLAQLGAIKVNEALGDLQGMQMAQSKYDVMANAFIRSINNRVDGSPRTIVNRNGIFSSNGVFI